MIYSKSLVKRGVTRSEQSLKTWQALRFVTPLFTTGGQNAEVQVWTALEQKFFMTAHEKENSMQGREKMEVDGLFHSPGQESGMPIANLSGDVYESAPPAVKSRMLSELVGSVYETAPPVVKTRLIAHLMRPLGILSLVAVANGIFARIRFRDASPDFPVGIDDVQNVQTSDVIALASHAQQVSMQAVDGLSQILATSPVLMSSAAALLLVQILIRQSSHRRVNDGKL